MLIIIIIYFFLNYPTLTAINLFMSIKQKVIVIIKVKIH